MHFSPSARPARVLAIALAVIVVLGGVRLVTKPTSGRELGTEVAAAETTTTTVTPTTALETPTEVTTVTTPTTGPSSTTTVAPTTTAAAKVAAAAAPAKTTVKITIPKVTGTIARKTAPRATSGAAILAAGGGPYRGLGTWVDVYDWTLTYTKNKPTFGPDDVDHAADLGVQTLYIQAA